MYNILIATSQHTSLFFPLGCFLLPSPTALLRPVLDSGLVKSSNLSYTWHGTQEEIYDVETETAKRKSKRQQDEFSTGWKFSRTFTRIRNHDFSRKPQHGVATFLRYCFEWLHTLFQHCNAVLRRIVSYNITLTVRKFRRIAVQSSVWTAKNIERLRVNDVSAQIF